METRNQTITENVVKTIIRTVDRIAVWCYYFGCFSLLFMALSTTYDVVMRYFFSRPTHWSQDINENILVYATYLSAPWILKIDRHVMVNILTERLSPKWQHLSNIIASSLGVLTCSILLWKSLSYTLCLFASGELQIRSLVIPKWMSLAPIPFGAALLCIYFGRRIYISFSDFKLL